MGDALLSDSAVVDNADSANNKCLFAILNSFSTITFEKFLQFVGWDRMLSMFDGNMHCLCRRITELEL